MAARKVIFAKLHEPYQHPGVPGLSTLSRSLNAAEFKGLVMFLTEVGLEASYKGVKFWVPHANLAGVTLDKADVTEESKIE